MILVNLIIQNGLVLTVEAAEGTDAMIARSKILKIGDMVQFY